MRNKEKKTLNKALQLVENIITNLNELIGLCEQDEQSYELLNSVKDYPKHWYSLNEEVEILKQFKEGIEEKITFPNEGQFHNIDRCYDKEELYYQLNNEQLQIIENVLQAYEEQKIDLYDIQDVEGDYELIIKDDSYKPNGYELLILKWFEDLIETENLIEILNLDEESEVR